MPRHASDDAPKHHAKAAAEKSAAPKLKTTRVSVIGGNTDGKTLFMEIDAFDGEHNNKFYPHFDADASSDDIIEYMKSLIDGTPQVKPEIASLMNATLSYDNNAEKWMLQPQTGPVIDLDEAKKKKKSDD